MVSSCFSTVLRGVLGLSPLRVVPVMPSTMVRDCSDGFAGLASCLELDLASDLDWIDFVSDLDWVDLASDLD